MYPITNEVKALFEAEQRKVLRITGKPLKKDNVSVGPSDIVTVNDAADISAKDITIGIEPVQAGSGDPSPTNVQPISGWTGANVTRTGFNVWDEEWESGYYLTEEGTLYPISNAFVSKNYIHCSPSTSYYFKNVHNVCFYDENKNIIKRVFVGTSVYTTPSNAYYMKFDKRSSSTYNHDICINISDPAKNGTYEPGHVVTYPISWQSEAGTVYGGTLDVTTGLLTVDAEINQYTGNENWYTSSGYRFSITGQKEIIKCNQYRVLETKVQYASQIPSGTIGQAISGSVYISDERFNGTSEWKAHLSDLYNSGTPLKVIRKLATPQTYQLSPTDVALLLGENNVWADTGETTLIYRPYAELIITDDNVIEDSFQIDRYSCNGEKLEVGTAIAAQMSFTLENGNGDYDDIVFEDAELFAEVGIADWTQSSPTITYVPCGYFTPDNQPRRLSTISITALDRMTLFDIVVDAADLTFPTTVAGLVGQVCTVCGVTLAQSISGLVNASVAVTELPTVQGEITYRNLIQWCAGIMGSNAWFDWNGQLRFSWYENATGYVSTVDNRYSSDLYEDDLTVSGVEYTNNSGIVIVEGTDDYAVDLTGNAIAGPLVATVLSPLNTALNGFTYRPFTAAVVNAPYLWPMDVVTFTDKDGNDHTSALTNVVFGLNGTTAMESKGMTYAINKLAQPKGFTREQAQLVNQAMEHVEQDIDESLTQQEIFNRLTDNGAAQGLVLYNGQLYINASYINAGYLNVGRIDFNDPPTYCNVPDENDVDSLFSGQTVVDGWIVNASGTGQITIINCGFALPLHGKTVSVTFEYNGHLLGGSDSWYGISDEVEEVAGFRDWEVPAGVTPKNPYTCDFYVDNDMMGFSMSVECSGVRRISVSLDSPVTPTKDIVYDYQGQRIGSFHVYRDGTLETFGKSLFNGPVRIGELFLNNPLGVDYGGTGADTAADARANLEITPVNIGAVAVGPDTSDVTIQQSPSLNFPVQIWSHGNLGRYVFSIAKNGDLYLYDEDLGRDIWTLNNPVTVLQGGTGATTPAGACAALAPGIPTSSYSLITSYGPGVTKWDSNADANNLRCIKFGNGLKRLTGLFIVTTTLSQGAIIFTLPSGFSREDSNNGSIQGFVTMFHTDGTAERTALMSGSNVILFSGTGLPTGAYTIDHFYF